MHSDSFIFPICIADISHELSHIPQETHLSWFKHIFLGDFEEAQDIASLHGHKYLHQKRGTSSDAIITIAVALKEAGSYTLAKPR